MSDRTGGDERLRAERDERRRLSELVHDGPVQHLAALGQMLDAAVLALGEGDTAGVASLVTRAREIAREAATDLRDLIAGFEPPALHEDGFAAAVRELTDRIGARRGIEIEVDVPAADLLGERARSGLYQIVRESLDQALRRGPPQKVSVSLRQTPVGGIELSLTDDAAQERRQVVLDALAERTEEMNGGFAYLRTETGTTIQITLPPSAAYV